MDKKERKKKRDYDRNVTAFRVVQEATGEQEQPEPTPSIEPKNPTKNPNAVALGQRGGKARARNLTPEQRRAIARKAAAKRWQ